MKNLLKGLAPFAMVTALAFCGVAARADETAAPADGGSARGSFAVSSGPFGEKGQWVYSISDPNEFPFHFLKPGGGAWDLLIQPAADTFIAPNVSVGALLKFQKSGGGTEIGIGARFGYNAVITSLVSVWIRGDVFFDHQSNNTPPSSTQTQFDLKAPFLFHLVPHFFLGVGPTFQVWLQRSGMQTRDSTFGLGAIVGGYL